MGQGFATALFPWVDGNPKQLEAARPNLLGKGVEPRIHLLPEPIASPKSTIRSGDVFHLPERSDAGILVSSLRWTTSVNKQWVHDAKVGFYAVPKSSQYRSN